MSADVHFRARRLSQNVWAVYAEAVDLARDLAAGDPAILAELEPPSKTRAAYAVQELADKVQTLIGDVAELRAHVDAITRGLEDVRALRPLEAPAEPRAHTLEETREQVRRWADGEVTR